MNDTDREQFAKLIGALAIATRVEADELLLEAYWMALEDLPIESVAIAAKRALRECKFFPMAVELREMSGEVSPADRAVLAWDAFQKAVHQHGYYDSVQFDDPAITATVRSLGGWIRVCELPVDEFDKWLRKDFERVYASYCRSGVSPEALEHLPGFFEKENGIKGATIKPPVLIETGLVPVGNRLVNSRKANSLSAPLDVPHAFVKRVN